MKKIFIVLALLLSITTAYAQEGLRITLKTASGVPSSGVVGGALVLYGDHTTPNTEGYWFRDAVEYNHDSRSVSRSCEIVRNGDLLSIERRAVTGMELSSNNDEFPLLTTSLGNTWSGSSASFDGTSYRLEVTVNRAISGARAIAIEDANGTGFPVQEIVGLGDTTIVYSFSVNPLDAPQSGSRNPNRLKIILSDNPTLTARVVNLGSLHQTHEVGNSIIRWYPQHEEEVRHYEVQVWKDGMFRTEGKVPKAEKYAFKIVAEQPQQYRVVAVLLNRRKVYSDTITVQRVVRPIEVSVYPTFITGRTNIQFVQNVGRTSVRIVAITTGSIVKTFEGIQGIGTVPIDLSTVPPGMYAIHITPQQGQTTVKRITVVQR